MDRQPSKSNVNTCETHVFLLFMNVSDLEPNVLLCERPRRILDNVLEALETLAVLLLLLVYYTQAEVDLVRLVEVGLHVHDLREGLFRMFEGAIAIVEDANAIPEFGLL